MFTSALFSIPSPWGAFCLQCEGDIVTALTIPRGGTPALSAPTAFSRLVEEELSAYLSARRRDFDIPLAPRGTSFQKAVWDLVREIPYGETRTYGEIAQALGRPKAVRAVAGAIGRNPIWILIPCHRIIGADGGLHGYAGGLAMKEALLSLEQGESIP